MEQMPIDENARVEIDYTKPEMPASVKEFEPAVFYEGDSYCCLLGPDPQLGIFGCGETPMDAILDWCTDFERRLEKPLENDEVIQYIKDMRSISKKDTW